MFKTCNPDQERVHKKVLFGQFLASWFLPLIFDMWSYPIEIPVPVQSDLVST